MHEVSQHEKPIIERIQSKLLKNHSKEGYFFIQTILTKISHLIYLFLE